MKTEELFDREIYNIIMIHVARTWERIRLNQPYQEMPQDNIQSANDGIPEIATEINSDAVIQKFLKTRNGDVWSETEQGMSDCYIEHLAEGMIKRDFRVN